MTEQSPTYPSSYAVPSGGRVRGRLRPPSSKSVTNRYLNLALLAGQETTLVHPLEAEDASLFVAALERCGFLVGRSGATDEELRLEPSGDLPLQAEIYCGNGGTMYRFVVAALCTRPGRFTVDGKPRLRERPIAPLVDALRGLGARIRYLEREGAAPLEIEGESLDGGCVELEAKDSSQYLSALLMAGLCARRPVEVEVKSLASSPYVELTLQAMARFGAGTVERRQSVWSVTPSRLRSGRFEVEGDYSAAAYPAAMAVLTGGEVLLRGLESDSAQGDRRFLDLLEEMGGIVERRADGVRVTAGGGLRAITADLSDIPDQVPTLAALAPFCRGTTRIENVPHLRFKESDRLRAMAVELAKLGVELEEKPDGLVIDGSFVDGEPPTSEVVVETYDDHRIAMSMALVGLRRPGVVIADPAVVAKSYPGFWLDLERLLLR